jgi:D-lactate dehydrogenase
MNVAVFNSKPYDRQFLDAANAGRHELSFFEPRLTAETAPLADGFDGVCAFVSDVLDRDVLRQLAGSGTKYVAMRCAGYNNVDLDAAKELGIKVARVPAYAPAGVAEHAVALMLGLNRKLYKAYNRVREGNFALDGLVGFEMKGKTAGVLGTGKIGQAACRILHGFGMDVVAFDVQQDDDMKRLGVTYVDMDDLFRQSDVITLHLPLMKETHHVIDARAIELMKDDVMLINTSRGGLVDTDAVIAALKRRRIGSLGLDVYEEEDGLFFEDRSGSIMDDDTFARLLTFPNVLVTGHQAFFTREALTNIAETTIGNLTNFAEGGASENEVSA